MGRIIGIDLGTTNSCIGIVEGNKPVIIVNAEGMRTTPSVVAFKPDGERLVGDAAKRQAVTNPENTFFSIKRHMGEDYKVKAYGKDYMPQEISAMILKKLKTDAESYLEEKITEAVITVPAYFNDAQRQATKDAGKIAGLKVKRIINEPTSAAFAYGLDNEEDQNIMVYDLGGGTFDVSIIGIGDGIIEVLSTNGDTHLGGDDFDKMLTGWVLEKCKQEYKIDLTNDYAAMQRVKEECEKTKKTLSSSVQANISIPFIASSGGKPVNIDFSITRAEFENLVQPLINRTETPVKNALRDADLTPEDIDRVLLVGGSTRMPCIQQKVEQMMGIKPNRNLNPDECVALGAALQGGKLSHSMDSPMDLLLLDVTPLSLSIETMGGVSTVLIERNTTIPTRKTQIFSTASDNQTSVDIHVLQGERQFAKDNKTLGRFVLDEIPPAKKGVPQISVTFDIDANGIVSVSAMDMATGKEKHVTIQANTNMSDDEIESAIKEAKQFDEEDKETREKIEIYNACQSIVCQTERNLELAGKEIDDEKETLENIINDIKPYIKKKPEKLNREDVKQMNILKEALSDKMQEISEKLYV